PFYFHSRGQANTRFGDGGLYKEKSQHTATDQFTYDPKNPVPTNGGGTLYDGIAIDGPRDQQAIEERDDVVVYTSEVFPEVMEVTGTVSEKLYAKTDAKDRDFTDRLSKVARAETAYSLKDG